MDIVKAKTHIRYILATYFQHNAVNADKQRRSRSRVHPKECFHSIFRSSIAERRGLFAISLLSPEAN